MSRTTDDQAWATIGLVLSGWAGGDFTEEEGDVYRTMLRRFKPDLVMGALEELACSGRKFYPRPSIPEVAAECHRLRGTLATPDQFYAPPWPEVYPLIESLTYRHIGETASTAAVRDQLGEVVAAWFKAGGRHAITTSELGHPEFGQRNQDVIRRSYESWVASQRDCARRDLTVTTLDAAGDVRRGGLRAVPASVGSIGPGARS